MLMLSPIARSEGQALLGLQKANDFRARPNVVCQSCRHRGSDAEALVAREVVLDEVERAGSSH
jgi:hypothetical protein